MIFVDTFDGDFERTGSYAMRIEFSQDNIFSVDT